MTDSLPKALHDRTLAALGDLAVESRKELAGPSGGPVGSITVLRGPGIAKAVTVSLTVPPIGMDSHMLFAFTGGGSPLPHFTLDAVEAGGYLAFHLDLVPRVDLASHLDYLNAVFQPLTPAFERAGELFGASRAAISPRQYAIMSPWMLVHRASPEQFRQVDSFVDDYLGHWRDLLAKGLPAEVAATITDTDLAARDARNRAALFSREVDPVWANVSRLVGDETADAIRAELIHD